MEEGPLRPPQGPAEWEVRRVAEVRQLWWDGAGEVGRLRPQAEEEEGRSTGCGGKERDRGSAGGRGRGGGEEGGKYEGARRTVAARRLLVSPYRMSEAMRLWDWLGPSSPL